MGLALGSECRGPNPDLLEVVHLVAGGHHRAMRVAVEADVRPEGRTREHDIADADGLVLRNVHVHSGSRSPGLLKRPSQVVP